MIIYSAGVIGFEGGPYRFAGFCAKKQPLFTKVVFTCFDRNSYVNFDRAFSSPGTPLLERPP